MSWFQISGVYRAQAKLDAIVAPTPSNDLTQGFSAGSIWIDNAARVAYICTDATTGFAKWDSFGDIPAGGVIYKGVWNANTNDPALSDGGVGGDKGDYYIVGTAGTTSVDGESDWNPPDWIVNRGTQWDKVDNTQNAHALGGPLHTASSLAEFNSKLVGGSVDFTTAIRPSKNTSYVDPSAVVGGNVYNSIQDAYNGMGGATGRGVIVPAGKIIETGTHDGGDGVANASDSTKGWSADQFNGKVVYNRTEESFGYVSDTTIGPPTVVATMLDYEASPLWNNGDKFDIYDACPMDPGSYNFTNYEIMGDLHDPQFVPIEDGVTTTKFRRWDNCNLINLGDSSPIADIVEDGVDDIIVLFGGASMVSIGTVELMDIGASKGQSIFCDIASGILGKDNGAPVETIKVASTGRLMVLLGQIGRLSSDAVSGPIGAMLQIGTVATASFGQGSPQTNFAGTIMSFSFTNALNLGFDPTGTTITSTDVGNALVELLTRNADDWQFIPGTSVIGNNDRFLIEDEDSGSGAWSKAVVTWATILNLLPANWGKHITTGSGVFVDDSLTVVDTWTIPGGLATAFNILWEGTFEALVAGEVDYGIYIDDVIAGVVREKTIALNEKGSLIISSGFPVGGGEVITIKAICDSATGLNVNGRGFSFTEVKPLP